jgi:hypothetical protein
VPTKRLIPWLLVASVALCACADQHKDLSGAVAAHDAALREMPRQFYRPGLGDQMNALQLRHEKLWFAGNAENWPLAAFELEEIDESLQRVAQWHAENKDLPMGPSIKAYTQAGRYDLSQSIAHQDRDQFVTAFDELTNGCNRCHQSAKHSFIVIQRPTGPSMSNQTWTPSAK